MDALTIARGYESREDAALARVEAIAEAREALEERLDAALDAVWPQVVKALGVPAGKLDDLRERLVWAAADHIQSDY
jgi:hypothetical protein